MQFFVDHEYGEIYENRKRRGGFAWNEAKGSGGKAGYHSIETGYYTYLYGNLLYNFKPATLHYNFEPLPVDREINLTPLAISDSDLNIAEVLLDGVNYSDFDPTTRVLSLPANTGGHFTVKYQHILTDVTPEEIAVADGFELMQNYPNPFNPSTNIEFRIENFRFVSLKVYDILGNEVANLVNEEKDPGNYKISFNAARLSSGIYFYTLSAGNFVETKKMILLK
jgi:hypothetical protein